MGRYVNKYDMWNDTIQSGLNFRALADERDKTRQEQSRQYDETRADRQKQWDIENARADKQMGMREKQFNTEQEMRQLASDLYKSKMAFLQSGGNPQIASALLTLPMGADNPVRITENKGQYMIQVGNQPAQLFARNKDEYFANMMAQLGDESYMKAIFAKKLNNKPQAINPDYLVQKGDEVGVLQQPSGGGAIQFSSVDGVEMPKDYKKTKQQIDAAKALTDREMKDLKAVLAPFAKPGKQLIDFETGELSNEGKSALDAALDLINKDREGKPLSSSDKEKLTRAKQAWRIYNASADRISSSYGEPDKPGKGKPIDFRRYDY